MNKYGGADASGFRSRTRAAYLAQRLAIMTSAHAPGLRPHGQPLSGCVWLPIWEFPYRGLFWRPALISGLGRVIPVKQGTHRVGALSDCRLRYRLHVSPCIRQTAAPWLRIFPPFGFGLLYHLPERPCGRLRMHAFGFLRAHCPIGLPSRSIGNQPATVRATDIHRDIDAYLLPMPSAWAL